MQVHRLTTAAGAAEPVTAAEFMQWARITDANETATAERLVKVARQEVEQFTGHVLVPGTFAVTAPSAYDVPLPLVPIEAVDQVQSIDASGVFTPLDPGAYASLLTVAPGLLRVLSPAYGTSALEVVVTAGPATPGDVPEDLKQAVLDVALLHYQHRDDPELLNRVRAYLHTLHLIYGLVQA